jgi:HEAT repeat protein
MSGPTRFCPACYAMNSWSATSCETCGASLAVDDGQAFNDRLTWALRHPDTETAMRAAEVLAARHAVEAIAALAGLVDQADDPYRSAAAAAALVAFAGDPVADAAIQRAAAHPSVIVRIALERSRAEHGRG